MTFTTPAVLLSLAPTAPSLWDRLTALRVALAERVALHRSHRAVVAELEALSDRDLTDLGLVRADIGRVAREAARV